MTSLATTLKTDLSVVITAIKTGLVAVGSEVETIVVGVAQDEWTQAKKLFAQSSIGTTIENGVSDLFATGTTTEEKIEELIELATAEITKLAAEGDGNVLKGFETELKAFATALVNDAIAAFEANGAATALLALAAKL